MGRLKWAKELAKKTEKAKTKKEKREKLEAKAKKAWDDSVAKSHEDRHKFKQDMGDMWEAQDKKAAKKIAKKNKKTLDKVKKMKGVSDETKLTAKREQRAKEAWVEKEFGGLLKPPQEPGGGWAIQGMTKKPKRHAAGGPVKKSIDGIATKGLTRAKHKQRKPKWLEREDQLAKQLMKQ